MDRAYSVLSVKALDDGARRFSGTATTPTMDRDGDIIDPMGAKFADEMPLLWQHDPNKPVGRVRFRKPSASGIDFDAEIANVPEEGDLKKRLDMAWQSIKYGLVRAVSIGFQTLTYERMENGGLLVKSWECLELSAVTIPANSQAIIAAVKSLDISATAAAVASQNSGSTEPAALGKTARVVRLNKTARDGAPFIIQNIRRL